MSSPQKSDCRYALAWLCLSVVIVAGCGPANDGPPRFRLSGSVTYDGKPVVAGFVTFAPDTAKGNSGPGGGAPIRNGSYRTEADKGIVGGPHKVRIIGYDGVKTIVEGEELSDGKPLFEPYEASVDFPKQTSTHDFVIPIGKSDPVDQPTK